jgi:orotate phosphoribosyltransferase
MGFSAGDFALALARAGLIQFGRFAHADGSVWPVQIALGWLPSYPALLAEAAAGIAPLLERVQTDRLLTTADAVPLGVAVSLRCGLPMTYPRGELRDTTAAFAIEGAYDVGHPTVLLADTLIDAAQAGQITALARRVWLDVRAVVALLDVGRGAREDLLARGYTVHAALTLRDCLPVLAEHGLLPSLMRAAVEMWLAG